MTGDPIKVADRFLLAARQIGLPAWLNRYFSKHPSLRRYSTIPVVKVDQPGAGSHPEARYTSQGILLYPKFWTLAPEVQDFVFTHELGHHVESQVGLPGLIKAAESLGIDPWDTGNLPFGQGRMDEAFADSFASYHTDGDVTRRYPQWTSLVENLS